MSETILVLARTFQEFARWRDRNARGTRVAFAIAGRGAFRGRRNGHPVIALEGWWLDLSDDDYAKTMQELIITEADIMWRFA